MVKEEYRKYGKEASPEAIRKKVDEILYKLALIDIKLYMQRNRDKKKK
jgi:hypothetical protein